MIKKIIGYYKPVNRAELFILVLICMLIVITYLTAAGYIPVAMPDHKPTEAPRGNTTILILREETIKDARLGYVVVVDYLVDGVATNVLFRPGEEDKYDAFFRQLEKLGEVVR